MQSQHTFKFALGWFELGNYVEAFNELDNLPPEHRASVEAMERCRIYRKLEKWRELELVTEGCLASVEDVTRIPFACHHAWALLKQGRAPEAEAVLGGILYECSPELLFHKACVLSVQGKTAPARRLLSDAIQFSIDPDAMKLRALEQPELESIWRSDA